MVAIAYGQGIVWAEQYEKMNGAYFARFIERNFLILFETAGKGENERKIFVMDNDPSQTSGKSKAAMAGFGVLMEKIPPRSPDLYPIENVFNIVRQRIQAKVKQEQITHQTWDEFVSMVKQTIWSTPRDYIDKTISSMPKRLKQIVEGKGRRTKY